MQALVQVRLVLSLVKDDDIAHFGIDIKIWHLIAIPLMITTPAKLRAPLTTASACHFMRMCER